MAKKSVDKVYYLKEKGQAAVISNWLANQQCVTEEIEFGGVLPEGPEGLVVFNENQEIGGDLADLKQIFDKRQMPVKGIDINGTVQVAISNFELWLERTKCRSLLIAGATSISNTEKFEKLLERISLN